MDIFSSNIKRFRDLKSLSVEALAKELRVNRRSVYDWEDKDIMPRKKKLYRLAEVLGVRVSDLFADEKEQKLTSVCKTDEDLSDELEEARKLNAEYRRQLRVLRHELEQCKASKGAK